MSIGIRQTSSLDSSKQPDIKEINDSINWRDSIKGEGLEAYLETTKKVVGYVNLNQEDTFIFVNHLAVHNSHQKKGIGKMLLKETFAIAQEENFSSVKLFSMTQKSHDFYIACAPKLGVNYEAQESGFFLDPEGTMVFNFFLDENTPPLQRLPKPKPKPKSFFSFY